MVPFSSEIPRLTSLSSMRTLSRTADCTPIMWVIVVPMRCFQTDVARARDPKVQLLPTFFMKNRVIFRLKRYSDRVSIEYNEVRLGYFLEQDSVTVPALRPSDVKSLPRPNMPPNFSRLELRFRVICERPISTPPE